MVTDEELDKAEEKKTELPLAPIKRILKSTGINKISTPALKEIRAIVQDIMADMGRNSIVYMKHRKGKIVTREDVLLAIR